MRPIKFHIDIKAQDCYIYCGHIFIVTNEGELIFCSFTKFIKQLIEYDEAYATFLRLVYLRNDYLHNKQSEYIFDIPSLKNTFDKTWEKISLDDNILLSIDLDDFKFIGKIHDLPIYDMKAYAMHLFIATKNGLYETELISKNGYDLEPTKLEKVFDQKIISINAKSGEVFASAGSEGLFHGTFFNEKNKLRIIETPIQKKSLKTSWSSYNLFNYSGLNNFNFLVNDTTREEQNAQNNYSKFDDKRDNVRFSKLCTREFSMHELLKRSTFDELDILYCFNSSTNGFFYLNDGSFYVANFIKDKKDDKDDLHFSSRKKIIKVNAKTNRRPLSSQIIPNGCAIEFLNSISIFQNDSQFDIEKESAFSFRSYINSIRYKNLLSIVKEDVITIHAIYPFDRKIKSLDFEDQNEMDYSQ